MNKFLSLFLLSVVFFGSCLPYRNKDQGHFERIVVLGQAPLEMLIRLGYKEKIVGIGYLDQADRLEEVNNLPIMTMGWPDKESVMALKPDLIFALESAFRSTKTGDMEFWERRGVRTCVMDNYKIDKNLNNLIADFMKAGQVLNRQPITDSLIKQQEELRQRYSSKADNNAKRVLHLSYTGNPGKYYYYPPTMCLLDEIVDDCGGQYIDLGPNYFIMPIETIIQSNPDKIIITWFRKQPGIDLIPALQNDRILKYLPAIKKER